MAEVLDFTTLTILWQEYAAMPRQLVFRATTHGEWTAWHMRLSTKLIELLGGFPTSELPLQPTVLEERNLPDYKLQKVALQSEAELYIPCYVLPPRHVPPPYRLVIALHGHGSGGATHLLGLPRSQTTRAQEMAHIDAHNYDYAHQLACRGFMVFAPEQRGFGERMEERADLVFGPEMWRSSCRALAFNAMLLAIPSPNRYSRDYYFWVTDLRQSQ